MNRPSVQKFEKPKNIKEFPFGPCFKAGFLVSENAGWRTKKPIIDEKACVQCMACYMSCPEGVIYKTENAVDIDYSFCKGCGICAKVCKKRVISMHREGEEE
jgi:pyruvate ferredoxin oxidoreductase delta subunit